MLSVELGPLSFPLTHLLLVGAFGVALCVGAFIGRRDELSVGGPLSDILLVSVLSARVGFVVLYFEYYQNDLLGMFDIRDGGFHVPSGLAGCALVAGYQFWRRPSLRQPLGIALIIGVMTWALPYGLLQVMANQGAGVPEVTVETPEGRKLALPSLHKGRPMVVNLWASWCPPCVREMPVLESAQSSYPEIDFVFVNQRESAATVAHFLKEQSLALDNVVLDHKGRVASGTGNHGLPATLFYDASGRLVERHRGELSEATLARGMGSFAEQYRITELPTDNGDDE